MTTRDERRQSRSLPVFIAIAIVRVVALMTIGFIIGKVIVAFT